MAHNALENHTPVDCISYVQPGGVFYACTLPAIDIVHRLEIRRRSQNPNIGVQRDENQSRVNDISKYAHEINAVFPTPIIVSANSETIKLNNGKLFLPNGRSVLGHVLDGQHRLLGIKSLTDEEISRFNLLIVFVFDIDVYSEATIFSTINSTQKQVSKSLMYDLFALHPGRSIEKTCHEIVRSLNDDSDSPFFHKIKILGKKVEETETLSQAAFVDQIARQIRDKEGPFYDYYANDKDWVIRKIIANYFRAIIETQSSLGEKINFPDDYFLKTTGFGGVAQSLRDIVRLGKMQEDITQDFFSRVMEKYFAANQSPPEGTGNSAMLRIKDEILKTLNQIHR